MQANNPEDGDIALGCKPPLNLNEEDEEEKKKRRRRRRRRRSRSSRKVAYVVAVARSPRPRFKCHITNVSPHQEPLNILVISKTFGKTRTKASTRCLNLKSDVFHPTDLIYSFTFTYRPTF